LITKSVCNWECTCRVAKAIFSRHWISQISWHMEGLLLTKIHHARHLQGFIVIVYECLKLLFRVV
jgi:hypothetical protein